MNAFGCIVTPASEVVAVLGNGCQCDSIWRNRRIGINRIVFTKYTATRSVIHIHYNKDGVIVDSMPSIFCTGIDVGRVGIVRNDKVDNAITET